MNTPKIYVGTAGWSYKDWVPSFYPKSQTKEFDWLRYYARYFNVVEVNASYYTYLNPKTVSGWVEKLSDTEDFKFTMKLHQDFTHRRSYTDENIEGFRYVLNILERAGRLGGILVQFPYSFQNSEPALEYILKLSDTFSEYSKFIEVRHSSWNSSLVYDFFSGHNLTFCTIDQPVVGSSIKFNPVVTNKTAYIRFHGRNKSAWMESVRSYGKQQSYDEQNERYKYLYSPGELVEIEQQIRTIYDKVKEVFVIMNNHPTGYAVANAFELLYMLREKVPVRIPRNSIVAFPRLKRIAANVN